MACPTNTKNCLEVVSIAGYGNLWRELYLENCRNYQQSETQNAKRCCDHRTFNVQQSGMQVLSIRVSEKRSTVEFYPRL